MKNNYSYGVIRNFSGAALAAIILAGAAVAATPVVVEVRPNRDLAHYTSIAGRDTAKALDRSVIGVGRFADRAGRDTGKGTAKSMMFAGKTVARGANDVAHGTSDATRATGRFFRHVGRAIG